MADKGDEDVLQCRLYFPNRVDAASRPDNLLHNRADDGIFFQDQLDDSDRRPIAGKDLTDSGDLTELCRSVAPRLKGDFENRMLLQTAFRAAGVSHARTFPWSMIATRSQSSSASIM
jgi:hypothetical protein